jgi:hypothetical protein
MDDSSSNHGRPVESRFDLPVCINKCNLTLLKAFTGTSQKYCATLQLNSGSIIAINVPHHAKVRLEGEKRRLCEKKSARMSSK